MEENNKSKKFMLFGLIVLVITIAVSSTYAYYVWTTSDSDTTKIVAGVGSATVTFDGGSDINASLRPVSDKSKGIVKNISVKADTAGLVFNMYLDITSIDTGLKDESFRYELYKGTTKVKEGNFSDSYLTSNTVTCSKNNTNHIVLLTNESISTSKTSYTLYVWIDGANYVNPSTMMDKTFNFKLHADGEGAVLAKTAAETITELYTRASKTTVTNNSITYNTAPSVSLMNDRLGSTSTGIDSGNIRYYGASPNNYIYFNCETYPKTNCELWRIIGVVDGKVKLIRNESIGDYSWDTSASTVNEGLGVNEWSQADLMKLLNPGYESNTDLNNSGTSITVNNSLYYNSGSGTCYNNSSNSTTSCDFTSTGIKNDTTRNMIEDSTYYLGGVSSAEIYSNAALTMERGTTVISNPSDGITRTTSWTGKIGLMYPSDYGYATDFTKCSQTLYNYDSSTDSYACRTNDWLYNGAIQRLLTPSSSGAYTTWLVDSRGYYSNVYRAYGVRPVLYLNSELVNESGSGTESDPYRISA